MENSKIRKASHYNSWYLGPKDNLTKELESYLNNVNTFEFNSKLRGMIVPHAGIMWSGQTAAWGFKNLINSNFKKIFILGPSHFAKFDGCAVTTAEEWETPYGNLKVDRSIINKLKESYSDIFLDLPMDLDEYEHSLEMQIPYLGYIFQNKLSEIEIVPLMPGTPLSLEKEEKIAEILLPYYQDKDNFFIISEDFCHWGERHKFKYHEEKHGKIHQSIEFLDNLAFDSIKAQKAKEFKEYLAKWKNNLCGTASPVTIFISLMEKSKSQQDNKIEFVHYTKHNPKIDNPNEESVSYAVGLNYLL